MGIPSYLPDRFKERIIQLRRKGVGFGGERYTLNEAYNEHLDRISLLLTFNFKDGKATLGTLHKDLDRLLWIDEMNYMIGALVFMKEEYERSFIKVFKRKKYNKLRDSTIKLLESLEKSSTLKKAEREKFLRLIPPEIQV